MSERKAPCGTITGPCLKTDWRTPPHLLDAVRTYFGGRIPLDVATAPDNPTMAMRYFTEEDDGLAHRWGYPTFCNPPYGKVLKQWLAKMVEEAHQGSEIVALLPCARWEQGYFHDVLKVTNSLCFIRKRVSFINPVTGDKVNGNPYANMFIGINTKYGRFLEAFAPVGLCMSISDHHGDYE